MQRDLVERRGWYSADEFSRGLALAQVSPGPLAAQLALFLGWLRGGVLGATAIGIAFIAPSFLMVLAISALYVRYGALPWLALAFTGVSAAVIAILARSAVKLGGLVLKRDRLLWIVAVTNAVAVVALREESLLILLVTGALPLLLGGTLHGTRAASLAPPWFLVTLAGPLALGTLGQLFIFFAVAGIAVFGSGLAIVPYLYAGVVEQHRWLTERQFLDAIAVSMVTPGPVVITVAFIGYLVAGIGGAFAAALGVFLPVFLVVVIIGPHFERLVRDNRVRQFVRGLTAAATGAIAGSAVILASRVLVDARALWIAAAVVAILAARLKVPEPFLILAAAGVGVALG
jgi:chromate transporter